MSSNRRERQEFLAAALRSFYTTETMPELPTDAPAYLRAVVSAPSPEKALTTIAERADDVFEDIGAFSARAGDTLLDFSGSSLGLYTIDAHEHDAERNIDVYEVHTLAESPGRQNATGITERHPAGTTVILKDDPIIDQGLASYHANDAIGSNVLPTTFITRANDVLERLHRDGIGRNEYKAATRYHELGHADLVAGLESTAANDFLRSYEDIGLSEAYATLKGLELAERAGAGPGVRALLVRDLLQWTATVSEGFACSYAKAAFHVLDQLDHRYGLENLPDRLDLVASDAGELAKGVRSLVEKRMDGSMSWKVLERSYESAEAALTGQNRYVLDDTLADRDPKAMLSYIAENAPERQPNPFYRPVTPQTLQDALSTFEHNVTFNVFYMEEGEVRKATAVDTGTLDAYFMRDGDGHLYFMPVG